MISIEYLRQFRLSGYAIFDFVAAFLGIYLLAPLLSKLFSLMRIKILRKNWLFLTLPISILTHILVGNYTTMTKDFLDINGHYLIKIIIFILFILGMRGIKIKK